MRRPGLLCLLGVWGAAGVGAARASISPKALRFVSPLGSGTYGSVFRAELDGAPVVAKRAEADVEASVDLAASYLEVEEYINDLVAKTFPTSVHVAPYLGAVNVDGARHLVWRASGERTLREVLQREDGFDFLGKALCVDPGDRAELMREVLRQIMECVAVVHSCSVVHRDIKPENILVDEDGACLRLIDFGSACELRGWLHRKGYRADRGPCSVLYCPPEQLIDESFPFQYDIFSAAVVWLRCIMPSLQGPDDSGLEVFRAELEATGHNIEKWLAKKLAHGTGVDADDAGAWARGLELFDGGVEGRLAWRLLRGMLHPRARDRITARQALAGPYLGVSCPKGDAVLAPRDDPFDDGACYIDDFDLPSILPDAPARTGLTTLELRLPLGLVLEEDDDRQRAQRRNRLSSLAKELPKGALRRSRAAEAAVTLTGERGVTVAEVLEGGTALESGAVHPGDELVSVGPFDVAELGLDEVLDLISRWSAPTVRICLRKQDDDAKR